MLHPAQLLSQNFIPMKPSIPTLQNVRPPHSDHQTMCYSRSSQTKAPKNLTSLKHRKVLTMWGTQISSAGEQVSQAVRNIGCYKRLVEHRTSKSPLHKFQAWIFMILGKEPNVTYLEGNWMNLLKEWNLQFSSSPF